MKKVDVVIIGAGLNGLAAALALGGPRARQPLNVVVLDRSDPRQFAQISHDSRSSALTLATQTMFQTLGVWSAIAPHAQNMEKILVTDSSIGQARPSLLSFIGESEKKPSAAMVENQFIFSSLLSAIEQSKHIELITGQNILTVSSGPGLAQIELESETILKASLMIGADGRNSYSRKSAGLNMSGWDYAQSAITLTVEHELPHYGEAEEHFMPTGVFAILPLTGNRSSLVWTEESEEAKRLHALDDVTFLTELTKRFGLHRGLIKLASARHVYPLTLGLAEAFSAKRLALIGDAAHVAHPLAGLGLNLGFKDVACLADCIADALRLGQDIGSSQTLEQYSISRRFDTVATIYALDLMNRLFSNDVAALKFLRDSGMRLVDKTPKLKALLMQQAAGQTGKLPRLMQGLAA